MTLSVSRLCWVIVASTAFVAAHGLSITVLDGGAMLASYVFQMAAPLAAAALAWRMARPQDGQRDLRWRLVAYAFLIWALAMGVSLHHDVFGSAPFAAYGDSVVIFALYGVPLLLVLATSRAQWSSPLVRSIDAAMVVALSVLFVVHSYDLTLFSGTSGAPQVAAVMALFDAQNGLLALFAIARWFFATDPADRRLYLSLAAYTSTYCVVTWYYNHHVVGELELAVGSLHDVTNALPYAAFAMCALAVRDAVPGRPATARRFGRFVATVPPFFLTLMLVIVAMFVARQSFVVGAIAALLAILGYGVRSTLQHVHEISVATSARRDRDAIADLVWKDALTDLRNRRAFDASLDLEWDRARERGKPLSLLMIDIDHFKAVNDRFGHLRGDEVIQKVADALASVARLSSDVLARYGGEEFACLLPDTDADNAEAVAERMRHAVTDIACANPDSPHRVVSVSIGIASHRPALRSAPTSLVEAADLALYRAKDAGRNAVRVEAVRD